jgi:hypothetical protein
VTRQGDPYWDDDIEAVGRERQSFRFALDELDIRGAHLGRGSSGLGQHRWCHVDPSHSALLADHLGSDECVGSGPWAEVEHPLAGREPAELPWIGNAGEGLDGRLRHVGEL